MQTDNRIPNEDQLREIAMGNAIYGRCRQCGMPLDEKCYCHGCGWIAPTTGTGAVDGYGSGMVCKRCGGTLTSAGRCYHCETSPMKEAHSALLDKTERRARMESLIETIQDSVAELRKLAEGM